MACPCCSNCNCCNNCCNGTSTALTIQNQSSSSQETVLAYLSANTNNNANLSLLNFSTTITSTAPVAGTIYFTTSKIINRTTEILLSTNSLNVTAASTSIPFSFQIIDPSSSCCSCSCCSSSCTTYLVRAYFVPTTAGVASTYTAVNSSLTLQSSGCNSCNNCPFSSI